MQPSMFERFAQKDGSPGSGLGLAISKHIVDLMGGSIQFESDPSIELGTNCIVRVPLKPCEKPAKRTSVVELGPIEDEISRVTPIGQQAPNLRMEFLALPSGTQILIDALLVPLFYYGTHCAHTACFPITR